MNILLGGEAVDRGQPRPEGKAFSGSPVFWKCMGLSERWHGLCHQNVFSG